MEQSISLSPEEILKIINSTNSITPATVKNKGSFANCTSCFRGQRDHEAVEEFINSIETYKEIEEISDDDALKGLSLLLHGIASTWWQGVRKEAKTWADAITLIRDHFAPRKPPYQIYQEIFGKKQDERTSIDVFICQKRALLSQLPDERHNQETELDFVYGLLNIKYRKHIQRQDVATFRDLLEKGRIIEHNNLEYDVLQTTLGRGTRRVKRCSYCNFRGHNYDECRKRKESENKASSGTKEVAKEEQ